MKRSNIRFVCVLVALIFMVTFASCKETYASEGIMPCGFAYLTASDGVSFTAGNAYVSITYGVNEHIAFINVTTTDTCDINVTGTAIDQWGIEYALTGEAMQTSYCSVSVANQSFSQMSVVSGHVSAGTYDGDGSIDFGREFAPHY